jgi:hypothetical protein
LNFLVLPRLAFITGRIALIFQNRFVTTTFFRNFAIKDGELTPSRQKKERILLFCAQLFVTLSSKMANLLRLGKKKKKFFCFALNFS